MAAQEQPVKSRVIKIYSEETWNFFITQARNQGCLVIAHFTAAWCIPTVAMKPVFENLAFSFHDTMFLVVDVDDVKEVASKMKIKAMPSFVLMREGAQVDKLVGANPNEIWKRIDGFVNAFSSQGL